MLTAEQFLSEIDSFLKRTGMSATAFGKSAVNDPNFVHDLRGGRQPSLGLVGRVSNYMRGHETKAGAAA